MPAKPVQKKQESSDDSELDEGEEIEFAEEDEDEDQLVDDEEESEEEKVDLKAILQ